MQVVILAGGLGTRMLPFTQTIPKPLLTVLGKPFLEHQINLLHAAGFNDFVLLTGYLGEQIEAHFHGLRVPFMIRYSRESQPLGTGGALANAAALLRDEFMLVNGDTYLGASYGDFVHHFRQTAREACMVVYPAQLAGLPGNISLDPASSVVSDYNKRDRRGSHIDAGVLAAKRSVLDVIPPDRPVSFEEQVFPVLIRRRQLAFWQSPVPYFDMGTPEGMSALEDHLR